LQNFSDSHFFIIALKIKNINVEIISRDNIIKMTIIRFINGILSSSVNSSWILEYIVLNEPSVSLDVRGRLSMSEIFEFEEN
jgi:hypothetical protein